MGQRIAQIALVVKDYDDAIQFYTEVMQFELVEDTRMSNTKRWVVVGPSGSGVRLLLAKATNENQASRIGDQTGGRVFLFLHTDNFDSYFKHLQNHHVRVVRGPIDEPYGRVAVLEDLYGNLWDLIEPNNEADKSDVI